MGISRQEIQHSVASGIKMTDEGAGFDGEGRMVWDGGEGRPVVWEERVYY